MFSKMRKSIVDKTWATSETVAGAIHIEVSLKMEEVKTPPTKVLFLDIDGVINSERTNEANGGYPHTFDPVAIKLIRRVLELTGSVVVLSSSWRNFFSIEEVSEGLGIPILDRTPNYGKVRGDEVQEWLTLNTEKYNVTKYAIVDDNADFHSFQAPYFVKTDPYNGLMFADYDRLFRLLSDDDKNEDLILEYPVHVKYAPKIDLETGDVV
jgi:hypothetical protein